MMFIFAKMKFNISIIYEQQVGFSLSFPTLKFKKQQKLYQIEIYKWKNKKNILLLSLPKYVLQVIILSTGLETKRM